ncbi:hypothetical protein [Zavarzinia aquatilis]|nr:hypothetical protein [Zavarzinia aquatilis]
MLVRAWVFMGVFMGVFAGLAMAGPVLADPAPLTVTLADPAWTGDKIPEGQQCRKFGGKSPMTPALKVEGLPAGTVEVLVEFNDEDYYDLSFGGGHGIIGFAAGPGTAVLPAVPGETWEMPPGVRIADENRATGSYATPGYLPPCSGGNDHRYFAVVKAIDGNEEVLAEGQVTIGRF